MKHNKLPSKKEWDNIINEAFSSYEDHRFSERYLQKKEKIEKTERGVIMKKSSNRPERLFIGLTTAAVLAVVAVPTAAITLNHMNNSGSPAAQLATEAVTESDVPTAENNVEVTETPENTEAPKTYVFGWMPDDMPFKGDEKHPFIKIRRSSDNAGITPQLFNNIGDRELVPIAACDFPTKEEYDLEGKHVTIFYASDFRKVEPGAFKRNVWITFEGSQYGAFFFVSDNVEDDILEKIIENIYLVPAEENQALDYEETYKEIMERNKRFSEIDSNKENSADITEIPG